MVQLEGKRDRPVPLILTDEVKEALDVLLSTRLPCGVHASNPYFFASQSETGFIDTWQVLQKVAAEAGCVQKSKITATRMRKYAATVFQVINSLYHILFGNVLYWYPSWFLYQISM